MFVALKGGLAAAKFLPSTGTTAKELCKILPQQNINKIQVAGLTRAKYRDEKEVPNIKPFPYHKKEYSWKEMLFTELLIGNRVGKHTKLIVVDGPIACGKEKFAKKLAEEMDFLYLPQPTFDDLYITHYGYDVRQLDSQLPKGARSWDIERFCQDPLDIRAAMMQNYMLELREITYIRALRHIFCTGQGVVTVRSPWSDPVFVKAMYKSRYISRNFVNVHTDQCTASFPNLLKPHLVIYLDVPVDKTLENIKKKGQPFEKNAKAFTEKYLTDIELEYKKEYLPMLDRFSLMLCYDWTEERDFELVLEDIEETNFEMYADHETILADWRFERGIHRYYAKLYSKHEFMLLNNLNQLRFDCDEILISGEDAMALEEALENLPDNQYCPGFNPLKGDKGILTRTEWIHDEDRVTPLLEKYYERKKREEGRAKE